MFVFDPTIDRHDPRAPGGAWSGGQWSLVRIALGAWLVARLAWLLPGYAANFGRGRAFEGGGGPICGVLPNVFDWIETPAVGAAFAALGVVAALALLIGWRARAAALLLAYLVGAIVRHNQILELPDPTWLGLALLIFASVPKVPFLSVDARKRTDPDGGWILPRQSFELLWLALAIGSVLALIEQLRDAGWRDHAPSAWALMVCEAAIALAALRPKGKVRPWAWGSLLVTRAVAVLLGAGDARDEALLLLQGFAFDPGWLPGVPPLPRAHLFFDGSCGLCHRFVRLVLAEDHLTHFWVAPLQSKAAAELINAATRATLPDSVVLRTGQGALLTKSSAVAAVMERLGGLWRVLAVVLRIVPRPLRDLGYDAIAAVRKKLFATPSGSCPLLPPALRARFLE